MLITKKGNETEMDIKKINVHTVSEGNNVSIAEESDRLLRLDRYLVLLVLINTKKEKIIESFAKEYIMLEMKIQTILNTSTCVNLVF